MAARASTLEFFRGIDVTGTQHFEFASATDRGLVRSGNEDACGQDAALSIFVVCDGMGGAAAGEVASALAVQSILDHWKKSSEKKPASKSADSDTAIRTRLRAAINNANDSIHKKASRDAKLHGMGTTAVVLHLDAGGQAWLAHVGDSRCYRFRGGTLLQLTLDHSLVEEQVRMGQMTAEQAENSPFRNVITRAVGAGEHVEADIMPVDTVAGDVYLLCSDGLTRELSDEAITKILSARLKKSAKSLDDASGELIRTANEHGGRDNITCILVRVG
jgi:serine/threonine protein phosphatase PrpC